MISAQAQVALLTFPDRTNSVKRAWPFGPPAGISHGAWPGLLLEAQATEVTATSELLLQLPKILACFYARIWPKLSPTLWQSGLVLLFELRVTPIKLAHHALGGE